MKNRQAKKIFTRICASDAGDIIIMESWKQSTHRAALRTRRPTAGEERRRPGCTARLAALVAGECQ